MRDNTSNGNGIWKLVASTLIAAILAWGGAWVTFGMGKVTREELQVALKPLAEADERLAQADKTTSETLKALAGVCVSTREMDDVKQRLQRIEDKLDRYAALKR